MCGRDSVNSLNGPGEEAACEPGDVGPKCPEAPAIGQQVTQVVIGL